MLHAFGPAFRLDYIRGQAEAIHLIPGGRRNVNDDASVRTRVCRSSGILILSRTRNYEIYVMWSVCRTPESYVRKTINLKLNCDASEQERPFIEWHILIIAMEANRMSSSGSNLQPFNLQSDGYMAPFREAQFISIAFIFIIGSRADYSVSSAISIRRVFDHKSAVIKAALIGENHSLQVAVTQLIADSSIQYRKQNVPKLDISSTACGY